MKFDLTSQFERIGEARLNAAIGQQILSRAIVDEIYDLYARSRSWLKRKFERAKPFHNPWV